MFVLIWIVEAIGLLNLDIRPPLLPRVFLASRGCELAGIIYILGRRVPPAHCFVTFSVSFYSVSWGGGGGKNGWDGIVSIYVAPAAILRCGCIITVRTSVTSRYIQCDNELGAGSMGRFNLGRSFHSCRKKWRGELWVEGDRFGGKSRGPDGKGL